MSQYLRNHYWNLCSPLKTVILLKILASEEIKNLSGLSCDCSKSLTNFLPTIVTMEKGDGWYRQLFINVAPIRIIPKHVHTSYRPDRPGKTFAVFLSLENSIERYAVLDIGGNFITIVDHSNSIPSIPTLYKFFQKYTKLYKDF